VRWGVGVVRGPNNGAATAAPVREVGAMVAGSDAGLPIRNRCEGRRWCGRRMMVGVRNWSWQSRRGGGWMRAGSDAVRGRMTVPIRTRWPVRHVSPTIGDARPRGFRGVLVFDASAAGSCFGFCGRGKALSCCRARAKRGRYAPNFFRECRNVLDGLLPVVIIVVKRGAAVAGRSGILEIALQRRHEPNTAHQQAARAHKNACTASADADRTHRFCPPAMNRTSPTFATST